MSDPFPGFTTGLTSPGANHYTVTASDTVDLPERPRAFCILTDGNVVLRDQAGVDVTYPVFAGQVIPFRAVRVLATGTTATLAAWY